MEEVPIDLFSLQTVTNVLKYMLIYYSFQLESAALKNKTTLKAHCVHTFLK